MKIGGLPPICRFGKNPFERKLLFYFHLKSEGYTFELRYKDSTMFNLGHLPPMEHPPEFVPMFEISQRVFLFKSLRDKRIAKEFLDDFEVARPRKRKPRQQRHPRPNKKKSR